MILADTSVWIDHFRQPIPALIRSLEDGRVVTHPFVIGELAVSHFRDRRAVLTDLANLKMASIAEDAEVLALIDRHKLFGSGVGYLDAHLLASALITPDVLLWTRDRRLRSVAHAMGAAATET